MGRPGITAVAVTVVLVMAAASAPAQRPGFGGGPPGGARGAPAGPASPAPRGTAAPLQPTPEMKARQARLERIAESAERAKEKGEDPKDEGDGKGVPSRRERLAAWLGAVHEGLASIADVAITYDVRILAGDGRQDHLVLDYVQARASKRTLRHRITVIRVDGDARIPVEELLLHEAPGARPEAWRRAPAEDWKRYDRNVLDHELGATPLAVRDVLPFDPGRYSLSFEEDGERDGERVEVFHGTSRSGAPERLELAFTKGDRLLLRQKARRGGAEHRLVGDSGLRERDGVRAFERRRIIFPASGDQVVVQMIKRETNRGIDAGTLTPHP